jgi:hypothetical protein
MVTFIREVGRSPTLHAEIERFERERQKVIAHRSEIEQESSTPNTLPTTEELKRLARESIARQASDPLGFGRAMRSLIPTIKVFPYRLCDGGAVVLRAHFTLSLASLMPVELGDEANRLITRSMVVDLFHEPQRAKFREQVVAMRAAGIKEDIVAAKLGITKTAAQRAAALQRRMDQLGISDPYVALTAPPADSKRRRRHEHLRYKFDPLPDVAGD